MVENKYQPGIPEREALQDWDLREVVSFKFVFTFFSDPFTDLFDFPINSRYQDLDLNKEIFHKFCFTAMILMLTFMMWNDSRLKAHSLTWRGRQRLNMAKPVAVRNHHTRQLHHQIVHIIMFRHCHLYNHPNHFHHSHLVLKCNVFSHSGSVDCPSTPLIEEPKIRVVQTCLPTSKVRK